MTRSFDVFFEICLNQQLSKQRRHRWIDTPSCSLWRHCNGCLTVSYTPYTFHFTYKDIYIYTHTCTYTYTQTYFKENIKAPRHWPLCVEFTGDRWIHAQKTNYADNVSTWWRHHAPCLLFRNCNYRKVNKPLSWGPRHEKCNHQGYQFAMCFILNVRTAYITFICICGDRLF